MLADLPRRTGPAGPRAGGVVAALAATAALSGAAYAVARAYRADLAAARERLATGRVAQTPLGPVEYADEGEGSPVLAIHGAGGGFDQGLVTFRDAVSEPGYRVIAPSRFGYLGSPVLSDGSPASQADAFAGLLDALRVDRVAVMGTSAGGLSAMQFALRHPDRASCLVLMVPAAWAPPEDVEPVGTLLVNPFVRRVVMRSNFAVWAYTKLFRRSMIEFFGVPRDVQARLTDEQEASIDRLIEALLPIGPRQAGIDNDSLNADTLERYALEEIRAPTLVLDAEDVVTFRGARYTAEHIPGAVFVPFHSGGHLLVGHGDEVHRTVSDFLRAYRPPASWPTWPPIA